MKKCYECKKIVLPWQQSRISVSPIHLACHQVSLAEACKDPGIAECIRDELEKLDAKGFKHSIVLPKLLEGE